MKKVSLIVPVYNVEKYLRRCLDSLINQTYSNIEIICVNDCSPDNSEEIIKDFAARYDNVKALKNETNQGLGKTRNNGIRASLGDYVMFVDSDDYLARDFVETYVKAMNEDKYDIIVGGYTKDVGGKLKVHKIPNSMWSMLTYPIACAKLYKIDFIRKHKMYFSDIRCGEDIQYSLRLFYNKARIKVIDYAGYYYYFNPNSITNSMSYDKNHEEFVSKIFDSFLNEYDISRLSEKRQRAIEYTYVANMVNALITYDHGCKPKLMKKKYEYVINDMREKFPDYIHNPYFGILKPKGQTLKIRLGVGVTMGLHKVHLDKLMFYIISLI